MQPHPDWGIYTNIKLVNIKNKLIWAKRRVTNVTIYPALGNLALKDAMCHSYDIHHPLEVITQTRKIAP